MKKYTIQSLLVALFATLIFASCKKNNGNTPNNPTDNTIKIADVATQYFVIQKNVGKPLGVIYFVNENGTTKFYYDARGSRRTGNPEITNVDAANGTATLKIDYDANGANVFEFSLKKSSTGLQLTQVQFQGSTSTVTYSKMYSTSGLSGFTLDNGYAFGGTISNGTSIAVVTYSFSGGNCIYQAIDPFTGIPNVWSAPYYSLNNNVGFKVDSKDALGVCFKKDNGKMGFLVDNAGTVAEFEK